MKNGLAFRIIPLIISIFCTLQLKAQHTGHEHTCLLSHDEPIPGIHLARSTTQRVTLGQKSSNSNVWLEVEPQKNSSTLYYHPVAAYNSAQQGKAQLSLQLTIENGEEWPVEMKSVEYKYTQNGVEKKHTFSVSEVITSSFVFQNGRDYHEIGDVVYLDQPFPTSITITVGFSYPTQSITVTKNLVPYDKGFELPFRAYDIARNELWESASTHGGGSQVFGYDMGVEGWVNGTWSNLKPGTDGTANEHFRCWGKPIYAMADGVVLGSLNTCPDNPAPGQLANFPTNRGNYFVIEHNDDLVAAYCHFQKGSLNPALMAVGTVIKKGDFLGLTGNSGNSTGPHLHLDLAYVSYNGNAVFRPLLFNTGYVIEKTSLTNLAANAPWVKLETKGIPGKEGKRSFIFPADYKPSFSSELYTGVFRAGTDGHWFQTEMSRTTFVNQNNNLKNQGLRLNDISIYKTGTTLKYAGVWRAGSQNSFVQPGTTWANFASEWQTKSAQGLRLIDIETYIENGATQFAGVYSAGTWGHYFYVGMTKTQLESKITTLAAQNYGLTNVEIYKEGGVIKYAGIWKAGALPQKVVLTTNWNTVVTNWQNFSATNFRLLEYDSYQDGSTVYHSAVFGSGSDAYALYSMHFDGFRQKWQELSAANVRLVDLEVRGTPNNVNIADSEVPGGIIEEALVGENEETAEERTDETANVANMSLFPNPTSTGAFEIVFDAPISGKGIAQLFDMQGKLLVQTTLQPNEMRWHLTPGDLPSGVYLLRVQADGKVYSEKLMVE